MSPGFGSHPGNNHNPDGNDKRVERPCPICGESYKDLPKHIPGCATSNGGVTYGP